MARPKGVKNKNTEEVPDICRLSPAERIELLANLIVDRILDDQAHGKKIYRKIKE